MLVFAGEPTSLAPTIYTSTGTYEKGAKTSTSILIVFRFQNAFKINQVKPLKYLFSYLKKYPLSQAHSSITC